VEWRGEDDTNDDALEEILQEAIVITDDDDDVGDSSEYDENNIMVDQSEPDMYADNEDSSDDRMMHDSQVPSHVIRHSNLTRNGLQERRQVVREKNRPLLQARWRDARSRALGVSVPEVASEMNQIMPPTSLGQQPLGQIHVPVDHRGRAPKSFVRDGFEYIRVGSIRQ